MVMCAVEEPPLEIRGTKGEDQNATNKSASATSEGEESDNGESRGNVGAATGSYDGHDGFGLCPRTILAKQLKRAESIRGKIDILVGIELEFYLYKLGVDSAFTRAKPNSNCNTSALYNHQVTRILDEVTLLLAEADINIMKYLP
jgi:glutamine synthetase